MIPAIGVLKFVGIFVTGILGVLGTWFNFHEKVSKDGKKRLNNWGRRAVALIIVSATISLAAQGFEMWQQISESEASRQRAELQLAKANRTLLLVSQQLAEAKKIVSQLKIQGEVSSNTLHDIKSVVTRVNSMSIGAELEVPRNASLYSSVGEFVVAQIKKMYGPIITEHYRMQKTMHMQIGLDALQNSEEVKMLSPDSPIRIFFHKLEDSAPIVYFYGPKSATNGAGEASTIDLRVGPSPDRSSLGITLDYIPSDDSLFIHWSLRECGRFDSNGKVVGLTDFAKHKFYWYIWSPTHLGPLFPEFQPRGLMIGLDQHLVRFSEFIQRPRGSIPGGSAFEGVIPSYDDLVGANDSLLATPQK